LTTDYYYYYYYYYSTEKLQQIDNLTARLNILLSDFADLVSQLSRLHRLHVPHQLPPAEAAAAAAVRRYASDNDKRNTFDELAVGGRFG